MAGTRNGASKAFITDASREGWQLRARPYRWQAEALRVWAEAYRGIVSVVTGAGKTFFAMQCMLAVRQSHPECRFLIVVPTVALLDQWRVALTHGLSVEDEDIDAVGGGATPRGGRRIVLAVLNSARSVAPRLVREGEWFLVVDECHRAASGVNRKVLEGDYLATLGMSATPEREYDSWFADFVVPALGPVLYRYTYMDAKRDGIVSDFDLLNVRVPMTAREQEEVASATQAIARELGRLRELRLQDSVRLRRLLLRRSRLSQCLSSRISSTLAMVDSYPGRRGIVFHESIAAANRIADGLTKRGHRARLYHSALGPPTRYQNLRLFSLGQTDVLVTCRALDEGLDVPTAEFGVIAACTASRRQRIQRLGRILRRAEGKERATVVTLYALDSEAEALEREAYSLEGISGVRWFEAVRV